MIRTTVIRNYIKKSSYSKFGKKFCTYITLQWSCSNSDDLMLLYSYAYIWKHSQYYKLYHSSKIYLRKRSLFPPDGRITPFFLSLLNIINLSDVSFLSLAWSSLALFPGHQGSCGTVRNGAAGLVLSFNIRQELKCWHVAWPPTLTMWLLCFNCILSWTTEILGVFSKTNTT